MHVMKKPYLYYRFQPGLGEVPSALDDTTTRNIDDLKRCAESIFDDPEKLEKIDNLCRLLSQRFAGAPFRAAHGAAARAVSSSYS